METAILTELIALSIVTIALATLLGFQGNGGWRNGWLGALFLGVAASIACGLCLLGFMWRGWTGLLAAVLLVALLGGLVASRFGKGRGGLFVAFLWLGYCAACAMGYWAAGWMGWLTITLPSVALFWYSLWRFSGRLLPIERQSWWLLRDLERQLFAPRPFDDDIQRERHHRYRAFRSLLTFTAGTNYPYYVVENGKLEKRVDGSPYGMFFAGPGIVITEPHQAVVITDGMEIKRIAAPGLTFTDLFVRVDQDQIVDLRPQLRVFAVEALTKDGIRIRVLTFVIFKIRTSPQPPGRFWADGESDKAILQAMRAQPVEEAKQRNWDDLVPMVAERVLQDTISRYRFDELCARDIPDWHPPEKIPREAIKIEFKEKLTKAIAVKRESDQKNGASGKGERAQFPEAKAIKCGGIQILGVGFTNLAPVDKGVIQRCVETWRTEWTRKMMIQMGEGATEAMRLISQARAQGQAEVIRILTQEAEHMDSVNKDILADVLVLRLLEALESMARRPSVQQLLPVEATESMQYLRRAIGEGNSTGIQETER
ncbi:MAG: hypothetical protein H8E35_14520 [Ardenticatenia bacterium]|nr:hypothetical protein [Ardenticatenia bacterium]